MELFPKCKTIPFKTTVIICPLYLLLFMYITALKDFIPLHTKHRDTLNSPLEVDLEICNFCEYDQLYMLLNLK